MLAVQAREARGAMCAYTLSRIPCFRVCCSVHYCCYDYRGHNHVACLGSFSLPPAGLALASLGHYVKPHRLWPPGASGWVRGFGWSVSSKSCTSGSSRVGSWLARGLDCSVCIKNCTSRSSRAGPWPAQGLDWSVCIANCITGKSRAGSWPARGCYGGGQYQYHYDYQ